MMMKHSEFVIGENFICAGRVWRCTDTGTRVIVAIRADYSDITRHDGKQMRTESRELSKADFAGPPYGLAETVFDEYDIEACYINGPD